jgi:hypothetical protein
VKESDPASPAQLLFFLTHAPNISALLSLDPVRELDGVGCITESGRATTAPLPDVHRQRRWDGVAQVLGRAYAGMGFHAEDVQCVLMAACTLKPSDPLMAFPGWRLVGPFEMALRYEQLCASTTAGVPTTADEGNESLVEKKEALFCGRDAEDEARRWRCGRFRYDPPECQTVAVQLTSAVAASAAMITAASPPQLSTNGVHLCFHRDDPAHPPGMLVEGTARRPTFSLANGTGWLSSYLCALCHSKRDAAALAVAQALQEAAALLATANKSPMLKRLQRSLHDSLKEQRAESAKRYKTCVVRTYSKLGLCVPVDKTTDVGYREPNIPDEVSFPNHLRDWEADFVASSSASPDGSSGADDAVVTIPFSRSSNYNQLREARPFSAKTGETLDNIFLCADIANDEGDFGASLELGLNCLTRILADRCVVPPVHEEASSMGKAAHPGATSTNSSQMIPRDARQPRVDPVLWHTYRLLDCAYMLLQRPLFRHILRCHLPLLADACHPVLLRMYE